MKISEYNKPAAYGTIFIIMGKKQKLKLLVITSIYPNNVQPISGNFNELQMESLHKIFDIKVLAPVAWFPFIRFFPMQAVFSQSHEVAKEEKRRGIEVYHPRYLVIPKIARCIYGFLYFFSIMKTVNRIYKNFRFDMIFATCAYPDGFASVILSNILKKPIILKVHGSDINYHTKYYLRRKLITYALNRSNKVIAVSNALKKKMIDIGIREDKIRVIYNGVNDDIFRPMDIKSARQHLNLPLDKKILLFIGALRPVKGLDYLIDAFHEMPDTGNLMLMVVGDPQGETQKKLIMDKIQNYGIQDKIILAGEREHQEIALWLNASDVLCLPSLSEGVPNIILEALSCGRPTVASNVGGIPEIITSDDYGVMVEPKDSAALAKALNDALRRNWERSKLSEYAKRFSWQKNAEIISKEIDEILG